MSSELIKPRTKEVTLPDCGKVVHVRQLDLAASFEVLELSKGGGSRCEQLVRTVRHGLLKGDGPELEFTDETAAQIGKMSPNDVNVIANAVADLSARPVGEELKN